MGCRLSFLWYHRGKEVARKGECRMKHLFIIQDGPYGSERAYNALRLAMALQKREGAEVWVSLMGDGVNCAIQGQNTPEGYYNVGRMLKSVLSQKGLVKV